MQIVWRLISSTFYLHDRKPDMICHINTFFIRLFAVKINPIKSDLAVYPRNIG